MTTRAQLLLEEAKKLSVRERAEVVTALLAELDGEPDLDADVAWAAEIERRAEAVLAAGEPDAGEAGAVIEDIRSKLRRR